jgi:hypothetical protein
MSGINQEITTKLVQNMLEHPARYDWTLQGLGMLRTYLDSDRTLRLHVWTEAGANEGVSELHTHPWDFTSLVIAGEVINRIYIKEHGISGDKEWQEQTIKCGEGGGLVGEPAIVELSEMPITRYRDGATYSQFASQIHQSSPADGTVTVIKRVFGEDTEHAYVYFPVGAEWVTAEPRLATEDEVALITRNALEKWF